MLNDQIRVSVIIPVKNGENTIEKTIESVLKQSYELFECIIVHGDSTDKTKKILDEKFSFLKTIHGKDKSIADAMNKGIALSNGSLISVLNSGDTYHKNTLKKAVHSHIKNPNSILHGNMRVFFQNGEFYDEIAPVNPDFRIGMVINHPTMFIPKKIMDQNGYYDDSFQISCDLEICLRYSKKKISFKKICDDILVDYEVGGISTQRPKTIIQEAHKIRKMHKTYKFIDFYYLKSQFLFLIFGKKLIYLSHKMRLIKQKRKS